MSTTEERRQDALRETYDDRNPLERCPGCGDLSLLVTSRLGPTPIDPGCAAGRCTCFDDEPTLQDCRRCETHGFIQQAPDPTSRRFQGWVDVPWGRDCEHVAALQAKLDVLPDESSGDAIARRWKSKVECYICRYPDCPDCGGEGVKVCRCTWEGDWTE